MNVCLDFNKVHFATIPLSFSSGLYLAKRSKVCICECWRPQESNLKFYSCANLHCPCLQNTSNHTLRLGWALLLHWRITSTYLDILNKQLLNKENSIPAMHKLNSSLPRLRARTYFSQMTPVKPLCCTDLYKDWSN